MRLGQELYGRNGVFLAKEGQGIEAYNVMRSVFGDELYLFRLGKDASGNPIDIAAQSAAIRNAKFIVASPSA
jgi:hypothetical protein